MHSFRRRYAPVVSLVCMSTWFGLAFLMHAQAEEPADKKPDTGRETHELMMARAEAFVGPWAYPGSPISPHRWSISSDGRSGDIDALFVTEDNIDKVWAFYVDLLPKRPLSLRAYPAYPGMKKEDNPSSKLWPWPAPKAGEPNTIDLTPEYSFSDSSPKESFFFQAYSRRPVKRATILYQAGSNVIMVTMAQHFPPVNEPLRSMPTLIDLVKWQKTAEDSRTADRADKDAIVANG